MTNQFQATIKAKASELKIANELIDNIQLYCNSNKRTLAEMESFIDELCDDYNLCVEHDILPPVSIFTIMLGEYYGVAIANHSKKQQFWSASTFRKDEGGNDDE